MSLPEAMQANGSFQPKYVGIDSVNLHLV